MTLWGEALETQAEGTQRIDSLDGAAVANWDFSRSMNLKIILSPDDEEHVNMLVFILPLTDMSPQYAIHRVSSESTSTPKK